MGESGSAPLVIFDCDGVLVDSEPTSNRVLAEAISEAGLSIEADEVGREFEGMRLVDIQARVEEELDRPLGESWLREFEARRVEAFKAGVDAIDGVEVVLRGLRAAGRAFCVASQARREKTELTLGLAGLRGYFDDTAQFSSTEVERGKPHPDLFRPCCWSCWRVTIGELRCLWRRQLANRGLAGVELGEQGLDPALDLVPGRPHRLQRLALRVLEFPVEVALAGDEGALVAAAHRHHHVCPFGVLSGQPTRLAVGEVDAELGHRLDHLGVDAVGRGGPCRARLVTARRRAREERLAHLRAAGVVEADEEGAGHQLASVAAAPGCSPRTSW
jgi:hypothetical protein